MRLLSMHMSVQADSIARLGAVRIFTDLVRRIGLGSSRHKEFPSTPKFAGISVKPASAHPTEAAEVGIAQPRGNVSDFNWVCCRYAGTAGGALVGDFMRALDISRAVLTERLERLERAGILNKLSAPGSHPEYRLTEQGLDLWRVLMAMWQWERHWGTGVLDQGQPSDRPRSNLVHLDCGRTIDPVCACAHCLMAISPFDTYASMRAEQEVVAKASDLDRAIADANAPRKRFRQSHSDARERLPTLMRVFGDRWNAAIMAAALTGQTTFSEFEVATGIWPSSLSARLEELQALNMLKPRGYAGSRQEYRMTRQSLATYPITLELLQWGDRWLWEGRGPLIVMHRPCAHQVQATWLCPVCDGTLNRASVRYESSQNS